MQPEAPPSPPVPELIERLGGITKVHKALAKIGVDLSRKAVEKWLERNSIPYGRLTQLRQLFPKEFDGR